MYVNYSDVQNFSDVVQGEHFQIGGLNNWRWKIQWKTGHISETGL